MRLLRISLPMITCVFCGRFTKSYSGQVCRDCYERDAVRGWRDDWREAKEGVQPVPMKDLTPK